MGEREDRWVELVRAGTVLFGAGFARVAHEGRWRSELRAAYHRRAMETHPDRAAALGRRPEELLRTFREVTEAYAVLSAHVVAGPEVVAAAVPRASAHHAAGHPTAAHVPPPRPRPPAPPHPSQTAPPRHAPQAAHRAAPASPPRPTPRPGPAPAAPASPAAGVTAPRSLPARRLRLAEFLYYSGRVTWPQFSAAVAWQRQQRPSLGRLAVELGFLDQRAVADLLERRRQEGAAEEPFGHYAVRRGLLTASQLLTLLGRQQRHQRRIGTFFSESGLLLEPEIEAARQALARHNARVASRAA